MRAGAEPLRADRADMELCVSLRLERVPMDDMVVGAGGQLAMTTGYRSEPSLSFDLVGRPRTKADLAAAVQLLRRLADDVEAQLAGELAGVTPS